MTRDGPAAPSWLGYLLSDLNLRLCALFTLVFVLLPPEGIPGVDLCMARQVTHSPCPGCGMTRSGANLVRGRLQRALQYHPLGLVVIPTIAGLGLLGLMPRRWREPVRGGLLRWHRPLLVASGAVLVGFAVFGVLRWILVFTGRANFPATWP